MNYERRYIQFNELVFSGVDMISANDVTFSVKRNRTSYTERHGSWSPNRATPLFKEAKFAMTVLLKVGDLPCEVRPFYRDFAVAQLAETGRLWAVQNNTLVWAWAELDAFSENVNARQGTIEIDVDVTLPEGLFHKADLQKTFLQPWSVCDFMDCYDFKEMKPCVTEGECCTCAEPLELVCKCEACECLTRDMALCYHTDELQKFYSCDGAGYKIHYSCEAADRHFNSLTHYQGQKMCTECGGVIAGQLYSNTDIPTNGVSIRLSGQVENPYIEINGNGNQIIGKYDELNIYSDGTVTTGCGECTELPVENWVIPEGNEYGWLVHQGNNRVIIETGNCCGLVCAYFSVDALTV